MFSIVVSLTCTAYFYSAFFMHHHWFKDLKNLKKILPFLLLISTLMLTQFNASAQDSSRLRISLLTCTPGEELYSTFGHSAIRVIDSSYNFYNNDQSVYADKVYNYGTFNFDDKGFYLKFIKGQLKYYVSVDDFQNFKFEYQMTNRGITEQVLNLTAAEKIAFHNVLRENIKEENKFYMYDFFLDNCTTRLRDIIVKNAKPTPALPAVMPVIFTFRNAIHHYLDINKKHWSKFGIDLLLGAPTDAVMTTAQQQFLPDNLMLALDSTTNTKIVTSRESLYSYASPVFKTDWFTPMFVFSTLLFIFIILSLSKNKTIKFMLYKLDAVLFFATGLLGIILILMWVATDHIMTKNNYNILWAWPTHIIYAFFMNIPTKRIRTYSLLTAIFLTLLLCIWFFLAQQMNNALIPLVLLLIYRSFVRYRLKEKVYAAKNTQLSAS
jgi:hypothetical protein